MNDILKKLKIKVPHTFLTVEAPGNFESTVSAGVLGCHFTENAKETFDSIHWFVKSKAEVDKGFAKIMALTTPGLPVWVYYPKGSSGIKTDLSRDIGWDTMMQNEDIRWLSMISFDDTWTTFCFRLKTDKDRAEETRPQEERVIFQYADSKTKTITLPEDMQAVLDKHPAEKAIFEALSFSNRREYVEWVVTAKQLQTREKRLQETIERLLNGWKNPSNR